MLPLYWSVAAAALPLAQHAAQSGMVDHEKCCSMPVTAQRAVLHIDLLACDTADISELNLSKGMSIRFPEGKDKLLVFEITMKPDEGIYRWGTAPGDGWALHAQTCICMPEVSDILMPSSIRKWICRGGCFTFSFNVSPGYPHEPPKVKCKTKVRNLPLASSLVTAVHVRHATCACLPAWS